jgi:hypothetical protein
MLNVLNGSEAEFCRSVAMSALPLKADIAARQLDVRFVPKTSSLMRCNNQPAVACFNFSPFHFCHTLINSSSRLCEQPEQIL